MAAYYNENDKRIAEWLKQNIKAGLIADGEVDTRSIVDVQPSDLVGFRQCHFFAGIGGWSFALRLAGWPDERAAWTGSCPCQPWSMAGEGKGTDDPRHLWPAWFQLVTVGRPATIFGEQSASLDGLYWLDLVYTDLEAQDYAVGTADIAGACVGSPDIRPRLWFVADTNRPLIHEQPCTGPEPLHDGLRSDVGELADSGCQPARGRLYGPAEGRNADRARASGEPGGRGDSGGMANTDSAGRETLRLGHVQSNGAKAGLRSPAHGLADADAGGQRINGAASGDGPAPGEPHSDERGAIVGMANTDVSGPQGWDGGIVRVGARQRLAREDGASLLAGFWADCDWIFCRPEPRYPQGCWRPVESGAFPLAHGISNRVLKLRGYGNAIKPPLAAEFIGAYMDITDPRSSD